MNDRAATLALFFPERMSGLDFGNLEASGVHRIQQFLGTAQSAEGQEQLRRLGGMGVSVTFRIPEPPMVPLAQSYYNPDAPPIIRRQIVKAGELVAVEGAIVGNEPEHGYDLTWASRNWGNMPDDQFPNEGGKARAHSEAVGRVAAALEGMPVQVISPGWTHRRITPYDPPQPGKATWERETAEVYNRLRNGSHAYAHAWKSEEDKNRYLWAVGEEVERCHNLVHINETNVNSGGQLERMAVVIEMYRLLAARAWSSRIVSFTPFVSNGLGNAYKPGYIMQDRACYEMLGNFIRGN